ncbi:MAG: symmetrical bis(5'-nucleosyl)-tetraphosphatase [Pseudohongiella sp.]|uniref:symmetrical bis(5'-nucleosyl)-tetraphosphatase n=1 Tax=Pseudohongiella sp. TaxID=1979412 RepID=UPI0034A0ABE2
MATYAIGDIQGCYKSLRKLLKAVAFQPGADELWCVGDLINRGPKSLDTLRYLRDIGDAATVVLGNHDLHFLALYYECTPDSINGKHTLDELLAAPDCGELAEWLRQKPLTHYDSVLGTQGIHNYLMVHAGVPPQWDLHKTLTLSAEVETALRGPDFRKLLNKMYGNKPLRWKDSLSGRKRLRMITNYLTRMRFCDARGKLDLLIKEGVNEAPEGFRPWFEFETITDSQTSILFGHWAALQGVTLRDRVYALDTGCVWGRELTMMRLEDHKLFSV